MSTAVVVLLIMRSFGKENRGMAMAIGYVCLVLYMIVYNSAVGGFKGIAVMENVYWFGFPTLRIVNFIAELISEHPSPPVWVAYLLYFLGVFQYYFIGWAVQKVYSRMRKQ